MKIAGSLIFEGRNCLNWIKKNEEGQIEMLFKDCEENEELDLTFDPKCFEALADTICRFRDSHQDKPITHFDGSGRITPDIYLSLSDDKRILFNAELYEIREDASVTFKLSRGKEKVEIIMSTQQVKELAERFLKIAKIADLEKEVQTEKTIETPPVP